MSTSNNAKKVSHRYKNISNVFSASQQQRFLLYHEISLDLCPDTICEVLTHSSMEIMGNLGFHLKSVLSSHMIPSSGSISQRTNFSRGTLYKAWSKVIRFHLFWLTLWNPIQKYHLISLLITWSCCGIDKPSFMPPLIADHVIQRTFIPFKAMIKKILNAKTQHDIVESGLISKWVKYGHYKITLLDKVKLPLEESFHCMTKAFTNSTLRWII